MELYCYIDYTINRGKNKKVIMSNYTETGIKNKLKDIPDIIEFYKKFYSDFTIIRKNNYYNLEIIKQLKNTINLINITYKNILIENGLLENE